MSKRIIRTLRRLPVVAVAWSIAARVWWSTNVCSRPLPSVLRRLAKPSTGINRPVVDAVAVVHRAVPGTGRGRCLPRSLILYGLLYRLGHSNCTFCLGVQPEAFRQDASPGDPEAPPSAANVKEGPILRPGPVPRSSLSTGSWAHAWVEVGGEPLAEPTDPRVTHRVLFRHPAPPVAAPLAARTPQ